MLQPLNTKKHLLCFPIAGKVKVVNLKPSKNSAYIRVPSAEETINRSRV